MTPLDPGQDPMSPSHKSLKQAKKWFSPTYDPARTTIRDAINQSYKPLNYQSLKHTHKHLQPPL